MEGSGRNSPSTDVTLNSSAAFVGWQPTVFGMPLARASNIGREDITESFKHGSECPRMSTAAAGSGGGDTAHSVQQTAGLGHSHPTFYGDLHQTATSANVNLHSFVPNNSNWGHDTTAGPTWAYPRVQISSETASFRENYLPGSVPSLEDSVESAAAYFDPASTSRYIDAYHLLVNNGQQHPNYSHSLHNTHVLNNGTPRPHGASHNMIPIGSTYTNSSTPRHPSAGHQGRFYPPNDRNYSYESFRLHAPVQGTSDALHGIPPSAGARLLDSSYNNAFQHTFQGPNHRNLHQNVSVTSYLAPGGAPSSSYHQVDNVTPVYVGSQLASTYPQKDSRIPGTEDRRRRDDLVPIPPKGTSYHPYYLDRSNPRATTMSQNSKSQRPKATHVVRRRVRQDKVPPPVVVHQIPTPLNIQPADVSNTTEETASKSVYDLAFEAKQRLPGQRRGFDLEFLRASLPNHPGSKKLLESILSSQWYREEELEPHVNKVCGEELLMSACSAASDDVQFATRVSDTLLLSDDEKRGMSVYVLFKDPESEKCLFCDARVGRQEMFLSHVRGHLDHRPYMCEVDSQCEICEKDERRRRFYSQKLLREHQAKPAKRVVCLKCRADIQAAGATRHLKTVHGVTTDNWSQYFPPSEPSTPASQ